MVRGQSANFCIRLCAKQTRSLFMLQSVNAMCLCVYRSQQAILQDLQRDIPKAFDFVIAESNFEVISGKQEGVYAWIAANYALQKFSHGDADKCEYNIQTLMKI